MPHPHILVTAPLEPEMRQIVEDRLGDRGPLTFLAALAPDERLEAVRRATVVLAWQPAKELTDEELAALGEARFMQLLSAGADHLPLDRLPASLTVASNVGAYAEPMAEHVVAMTLALMKDLVPGHEKLARAEFDQWTPRRRLHGAKVAILGFGGIGKATARLMRPFGVELLAVNTSGETDEDVAFCGTLDDLEPVLDRADVVVVALPLTRDTDGLFDARRLGWLKDETVIVNVARGAIFDQGALYAHLKAHPGVLAGLDAWWVEPFGAGRFELTHPFFELPNVLGSPHSSAIVPGALTEAAGIAADNVLRFLDGERPHGVVDRATALPSG